MTHPARIARPARTFPLTWHESPLKLFHNPGQPRGAKGATTDVGHPADHLGVEPFGDPLDVLRHVNDLLASCVLAAAMVFPRAGSRSPGSRGRSPTQSPLASPPGPCGAGIPAASALAAQLPPRSCSTG